MTETQIDSGQALTTLDKIKQRRMDRMRQGQRTAEIISLPSDNEIRVAIVPLLEREYDEALRATAVIGDEFPENIAGASLMDRQERREVICRAIRDPDNYEVRLFNNVEEMMGLLHPSDISHLFDAYVEMSMDISPDVRALSDEEIDYLKKVCENLDWKGLSGKQLYSFNRFLLTLSQDQLLGKSPGYSLINS
jgi:hypothetical protein